MAGDETPRDRSEGRRSKQVSWLGYILLIYTGWTAVFAFNTKQDLMLIGTGVGLVGLAVLATRPTSRRD